ncbi:ATP-binding protein [Pantoea trifolii]|uniref:ATP-binding protein n=1 Tax=Pantoea trifolii TaxID=2968030 RepID=UPI003ED910CE
MRGIRVVKAIVFWLSLLLTGATASAPSSPVNLALAPRTQISLPDSAQLSDSQDWLSGHSRLRVGTWMPVQPPFVIAAENQRFAGLTADYLSVLQQALSLPVSVQRYADKRQALAALRQGEVDLLADMRTGEDAGLAFSLPYHADRAVLIHLSAIAPGADDGLRGKTLYYVGDQRLGNKLKQRYHAAAIFALPDYAAATAEIIKNPDAMLWTSESTAHNLMNRQPSHSFALIPSDVGGSQNRAFATLKSNTSLIAVIDNVLQHLPLSGRLSIARTWGLEEKETDSTTLALDAQERKWVTGHPQLTVLMVDSQGPLTYPDENGNVGGFTASLLQQIAGRAGFSLKWEHLDSLPEMRERLIRHPDALIAVADASVPPIKNIIYSQPYLTDGWVLVTRKSSDFSSLDDMKGKRVAVYTGSYFLPELRRRYPQVTFVEHQLSLETVFSLWAHSLDGAIVPRTAADYFEKTSLGRPFRVAGSLSLPPLRIAMASGEQNRPLISIINRELMAYPPQALYSHLSGWQVRHAHDVLNRWSRYRDVLIVAALVLLLIAAAAVWRNRFLKRNLLEMQRLQAALLQARERADHANNAKSLFLSQMSHEIRTPMNALTGLLELELLGHTSPEQGKKNLTVAYESARSLMLLVGDILDMAKIESGTLQVKHAPVALTDVVNNCVALFRSASEAKGIVLSVEFSVKHQVVLFDSVMFRQIISNLLSNAIKFTPAEGEIEVSLYEGGQGHPDEAEFALEVCDSGIGLTPAQQQAVFEPFVQVDEAQPVQKGTGLGLSICRQLSELLGGSLIVESEPGAGATFIFRFRAKPAVGQVHQAATPVQARSDARHILVIDDHAPNRLLLSQQLESAGHSCVVAESAQQGLEAWKDTRTPFSLIITDCNMPGMSGFAFTERLRALERQNGQPPVDVIGFTAMAEQGVRERALEAGMTDCMFKPLNLQQLLGHIEKNAAPTLPDVAQSLPLSRLLHLAPAGSAALSSLIHTVIGQNDHDLTQLREASTIGDVTAIGTAAHSLLNTAKMLGMNELETHCRAIEQDAHCTSSEQTSLHISTCIRIVKALESELHEYLRAERADSCKNR